MYKYFFYKTDFLNPGLFLVRNRAFKKVKPLACADLPLIERFAG